MLERSGVTASRKENSHGSIHRTGWMHFPVTPQSQSLGAHLCVRAKHQWAISFSYRGNLGHINKVHFGRFPLLQWGTTNTVMWGLASESSWNHCISNFINIISIFYRPKVKNVSLKKAFSKNTVKMVWFAICYMCFRERTVGDLHLSLWLVLQAAPFHR